MRAWLVCAAVLLTPLAPAAAPVHACPAPTVPVYPGSQPAADDGSAWPVVAGNTFIATTAPLVDIQAFYYLRLPNEGWAPVTQLPGQYPDQHDMGSSPSVRGANVPQAVLEFSRNADHEHVRIMGVGGGYSIYVDCSD